MELKWRTIFAVQRREKYRLASVIELQVGEDGFIGERMVVGCSRKLRFDYVTLSLVGRSWRVWSIAVPLVWKLKESYPNIKSILVLSFPDKMVNDRRYSSTECPELPTVSKRYEFSCRNRCMVEQTYVEIGYLWSAMNWGGFEPECLL